ncbi:MAG TPA: alpha-amylase/4-alpha-glucanotransferase domain-containing protein [Gemmatimonadaceae bacterium]|nr:alpha-amylase/4-alpha-glucanotransferase domain-containing protein [Gemmatimonadaceae bacterium]
MTSPSAPTPVRFVFGVHLHQPVGNFDHVFADHARDVYRPLLAKLKQRHVAPALVHISGPLLEWIEAHDHQLVDQLGELAASGAVEFLLAGMYEPVLASIPRADRVEQVAWLREALRARFGVSGNGLWLTERVWEPELVADLADAGVRYALVDDRHFLVTGFPRDQLYVPHRTESDGQAITLLAINERLRYLIPFRPPGELAEFFRALHAARRPLVVLVDDGEKFGGWPGTREWVYERGWFDQFCDTLDALQDAGVIRLCSGQQAVDEVPCGGLAYLPTASYREMEGWALPTNAAVRLARLETDLGAERMARDDGALVRGSHWRNFLAKYAESNRMQKKTSALSRLCRERGDPPIARRAVARAQCNDALWHGVFGGLYLPHLRAGIWQQLALAEGELRRGESLAAETLDINSDGSDEVWIHSQHFSAILAPARGGVLEELTCFATGHNVADTLTRRLEAYHLARPGHPAAAAHEGTPSIHELETSVVFESRPPVDLADRAIGVARILARDLDMATYADAAYTPLRTFAHVRCAARVEPAGSDLIVRCDGDGFSVAWRFSPRGEVEATFTWDPAGIPEGGWFAPELSLAQPLALDAPDARQVWRYEIMTATKTDQGIERVRQGEAITPLFDAAAGVARFSLR